MVKTASRSRLDSVFLALSDSTRRAILRDVSKGEKTVGELAKPYPMSLAAVSKHLKVLENANLIERERQGCFHVVRLRAGAMRPAQAWLAYYERFWNRQLDGLEELLASEDKQSDKNGD